MKIGIAIPTFNEASNINTLLSAIYEQSFNLGKVDLIVLVIDDSSPDGTADIVRSFAVKHHKKNFKVILHLRKIKNGLGKAYVEGFKKLLEMRVDYIIQMDADLSHNPTYLPAFVKATKANDLVVGSRYINGGQTPDWSLLRRVLSRLGNLYSRLILGNKIADYTGGFNLFSANLMKKINPSTINSSGYGFLIELKYRALKSSKAVHEIPIVFNDRRHGKSKLPKSTIVKNLIFVPYIRFHRYNNKDSSDLLIKSTQLNRLK